MFELSRFIRRARQWRVERRRMALQGIIMNLPAELQKDIGWPAPEERPLASSITLNGRTRPLL